VALPESVSRITKVEADYKDVAPRSSKCANCHMFRPPDACSLVKGDIKPGGICKYWEKA